jgi:hypothetical protein
MSALKPTMVQKSSAIKPAVMHDSSIQYDNFEKKDMKDPKIIRDTVDRIASLDSDGHCEIYKTIRKFKPRTFFGSSSIETRFNIDKLSSKELEALDQTIRLCKEDLERKYVLDRADAQYRDEMDKLETGLDHDLRINDNRLTLSESVNPTEVEKIQEMLRLNRG